MPTLAQAEEAGLAAFRSHRKRIPDYADWYKTTIPKSYAFPRHVQFICDVIQRIVDGELLRVAISTPPGHGKSETITRRLPIYWGMLHSEDKIVFTGYNQTFADKNLSKPCREIAEELGMLDPSSTAMDQWKLTCGAELVSRGVGNAPTGINPISLLICDDPFKDRAMAESEVERENVWQWWTGSIVQRFWPRTAALVICTRWHEDDLIGRLKAQNDGEWVFLNLPAIAEEDDPMGRAPGEALWPEAKPIEFLEKQRKRAGDYEFEAVFQGNPTPRSGSFFQVDKLKIVEAVPAGLNNCLSFDNAYTDEGDNPKADWSGGPHMYGPDEDGIFYVEPWRIQKEPNERNRLMRQRADLKRPRFITVPEDPSAGKEVAAAQIRLFAGFAVMPVRRRKGDTKALVAEPFAAQVNAGNVRVVKGPHDAYEHQGQIRSYAADYIEELRKFPKGKNDDQVDPSADAFNKLTAAGLAYTHTSAPTNSTSYDDLDPYA